MRPQNYLDWVLPVFLPIRAFAWGYFSTDMSILHALLELIAEPRVRMVEATWTVIVDRGSWIWLLLIYTVPAEPSRKRAFIWRQMKKVGAVHLRDGVYALPQRADTLAALRAIAAKVGEFGVQATVVQGAQLDAERAEVIIARSRADRAAERGEIAREAEGFLDHLRRETEHRDFTFVELEELEVDLGKLRRWFEQVRARDYFGAEPADMVEALVRQCEKELGSLLEAVAHQEDGAR